MSRTRFKNHMSVSPAEYESSRRGYIEDRRFELIADTLAGRGPASRVLEIGSGSGALLARLAAARPDVDWMGVELDRELAAFAERHHSGDRVRFICGDVSAIENGGVFDFAYSVDVIHHFQEPLRAFAAIRARLRRGGTWLALEPNVFHPYVTMQQERMRRAGLGEDHFRPWRALPLLRAAGFSVLRRQYLLLFPASYTPPRWLTGIERRAERLPLLGGCVALTLSAD